MKTNKSCKCEICGCIVVVANSEKVPAKTMRALALANHVRTLHASALSKSLAK